MFENNIKWLKNQTLGTNINIIKLVLIELNKIC